MAAIKLALKTVIVSVVLVACGADDGSSTDTPTADPAEIETSTTEDNATTATTSLTTSTTSTTATTSTSTTSTTSTTTTTLPPAPESALYRVTIVLEWGPTTHPVSLPIGWHTSPAVLAAHETPGNVVPSGSTASPGIQSMAETGATSLLLEELAANPAVGMVDTGQRVDGTGSDELEVVSTQSTPLLSLVTMLAPSPDWFVGAVDVPLFEGGAWSERVELDLTPWDAGTDSGATFTSDNADTQPRQAISMPRDPSYVAAAAEGRFGYLVIERIG